MINIREVFGDIDIYLFDQFLKNRFSPEMKILDAGCGGGRNLVYFLRSGFECFGIDQNAEAIEYVRNLAREIAPALAPGNFRVSNVEEIPFPGKDFDVVISSAVLHFADDEQHFGKCGAS